MAAELGRCLAIRYLDEKSIEEVLGRVALPIRAKAGEAMGDVYLQSGREGLALAAYLASGAHRRLLAVGDKALEKGNVALAKKAYQTAVEHRAIDGEHKDVYDFILTFLAPDQEAPAQRERSSMFGP